MKDSKHRVLFQNADNTINMGLCFNNENIEDYDLFWFSILATVMNNALAKNEGLVCVDKELKQRANTSLCLPLLNDVSPFLSVSNLSMVWQKQQQTAR